MFFKTSYWFNATLQPFKVSDSEDPSIFCYTLIHNLTKCNPEPEESKIGSNATWQRQKDEFPFEINQKINFFFKSQRRTLKQKQKLLYFHRFEETVSQYLQSSMKHIYILFHAQLLR